MKCPTCGTTNHKKANHCIKCGTKFKKQSPYKLFLAILIASAVFVTLVSLLILAILGDNNEDNDDSTRDNIAAEFAKSHVIESKTMVSVRDYLERYGVIDIYKQDAQSFGIEFTYGDEVYIMCFYNDLDFISYDLGDGFQKYYLDVPVRNENGSLHIEQEKFEAFLRDYIGIDFDKDKE